MTRQFTTVPPPHFRSGEMIVTVPARKGDLACSCPAWCHRLIVLRGFVVIRWPDDIVALTTSSEAAAAAVRLLSGEARRPHAEWLARESVRL